MVGVAWDIFLQEKLAADGSLLASAQHLWTVADAAVLDAVQQIPDSAVEVLEEGAKDGPKQDWLTPVADALQTTLEAIKEQLATERASQPPPHPPPPPPQLLPDQVRTCKCHIINPNKPY